VAGASLVHIRYTFVSPEGAEGTGRSKCPRLPAIYGHVCYTKLIHRMTFKGQAARWAAASLWRKPNPRDAVESDIVAVNGMQRLRDVDDPFLVLPLPPSVSPPPSLSLVPS